MSCASPLPASSPARLLLHSCPCAEQPCFCMPPPSSSSSSSSPSLASFSSLSSSFFLPPAPGPIFRPKLGRQGFSFASPPSNRTVLTDLCSSNNHSPVPASKQEKQQLNTVVLPSSPSRAWKENRGQEDRIARDGITGHLVSPLKRKRPAKLAIPESVRLASLNHLKDFGISSAVEEDVYNNEGSVFAVSSKKGRKDLMEDTHKVISAFQGSSNQAFFGVFDGHGGRKAAEFAAENLGLHIADAMQKQKDELKDLQKAMCTGYLTTDSAFLSERVSSGACAVSALLEEGQLVVANAGDCMAVLSRNGNAETLTNVHRASNVDERQRIESTGGFVDCFNGVWRVQGTLAVTRALGDMNLKQWVCADPEVKSMELTGDCEFLILASDGLWDKVSDQEAVDCARPFLTHAKDSECSRRSKLLKCHHSCVPGAKNGSDDGLMESSRIAACQRLVSMAHSRGSIDDITVMIVLLQDFVKA